MSYGIMKGDYGGGGYGSARGDPGLFGFLGRAVGGIAKTVGGFVPGPAGMILRKAGGFISRAPARPILRQQTRSIPATTQFMPGRGMTGVGGRVTKTTSAQVAIPQLGVDGRPRSRRMNYGNVKALKRADRRITGFVKTAKSALSHTNYKVVSKSAGTSTRCSKCKRVRCIC